MRLFKTESDRFVFLSHSKDDNNIEEFCQQIIGFFDTQVLAVEELEVTIDFSIGIAKTLKIKTVAEYVEDKEILKIVKECGVDMA